MLLLPAAADNRKSRKREQLCSIKRSHTRDNAANVPFGPFLNRHGVLKKKTDWTRRRIMGLMANLCGRRLWTSVSWTTAMAGLTDIDGDACCMCACVCATCYSASQCHTCPLGVMLSPHTLPAWKASLGCQWWDGGKRKGKRVDKAMWERPEMSSINASPIDCHQWPVTQWLDNAGSRLPRDACSLLILFVFGIFSLQLRSAWSAASSSESFNWWRCSSCEFVYPVSFLLLVLPFDHT